ncbi:MAG TPA: DinB family protein [Candidatus Dormibacteraeota bacterium]|nr:DinB family protein [Candidatus Dormibacteraeota bacterium]
MKEPNSGDDLTAMRGRLVEARARLARLPIGSRLDGGPTDPATGESWHRGNVLGHVGEMIPFWTEQLRRATAGSGEVGRDQVGYQQRRQGIDRGGAATEAELKLAVDEGIAGVLELLDGLSPGDLERHVVYHSRDGDRDAQVGELLEMLVIGHVEEHLQQLASLG